MSVIVMDWVFRWAPTASATDLLILLAIADQCDHEGRGAYPSMATLAKKTRLTRRSVLNAIDRLKKQNVLVVHEGRGQRGTHAYEIVMSGEFGSQGVKGVHMRKSFTPPCESGSQGMRTTFTPAGERGSHDPSCTSGTSSTPPKPPASAGGWFTRKERTAAERIRNGSWRGHCQHTPRCDHADACLRRLMVDARARRSA
jgi:hypothetical protein